ncbi:type IV pilus assembly protein PilM, partial [Candidatus Falkowbacteria bacterium]|nr:type IV pilus assembly protein PilM [Candidatus Falkowbacteria bacterium]
MGLFSGERYLGIDIGTSSIKIVELRKEKGRPALSSYGFSEGKEGNLNMDWQNNPKKAAQAINRIRQEAGMSSRQAVAALPTYAVFSSVLHLTNVDKKEVDSAVRWEAKKVIPVPLEEMILDWRRIEDEPGQPSQPNSFKILLTGAPRGLVKKYIDIFKEAQINLLSLETETFSLTRSLLGKDKSTIMLVELGTSTTDITVVDKGIPVLSRSIDVGGLTITKAIGDNLGVGMERAEQFKYDIGVNALENNQDVVPKTILETINPVLNEVKYVMNMFESKNNKRVEKIVLSGGASLLASFSGHIAKTLDLNVIVGDPWNRLVYPIDLKPVLDEIGPRMSV